MRRGGEGRPSRDSSWREDTLEEMLEVERGCGDPPATAEQGPSRRTGSGTDKRRVQQQSQTRRASFTTVVSTFRLPKIPFADWLSLIKRMSPVLLA